MINNYTADIPTEPPTPPQPPASPQHIASSTAVPDSIIHALRGSLSNADASPNPLNLVTPIDDTDISCGYATASQIGVLAPIYGGAFANSFIVRTFIGVEGGGCSQVRRAFMVKVCHR